MYRNPNSPQAKERVWLCTLLVVFALGESYNVGHQLEIRLGRLIAPGDDEPNATLPPAGTVFFEQALALLKVRYEDPTVDQIEALNLIVCANTAIACVVNDSEPVCTFRHFIRIALIARGPRTSTQD